ncbi:hypothetical protein EU803_15185 [Loktanella sp. IMCC34160]|uniref:type II toxin-antitoxin system CcdA family antitoxin n=1 Tax=Loktanella sp. IMCC34160 TaxID=2510646 RepID=UPI00101E0FFD|nr:type II toxin-antitoxin system CcdA family antitoxin [Loktanella sp. IMCC34160]RYG89961.1 hypothetical protein EU803_15185 [Loktanella sp. IMCC34160]
MGKQRTNISVDRGVLGEARTFGLNVSAIAEAALIESVSEARARAWTAENAEALDQRRKWIAEQGLPLARWQVWSPGA